MSTDPSDPLAPSEEPEVRPSSTPDGPQTIPAPGGPADQPPAHDQPGMLDEPTRASNPNSAGPQGLSGDMGVSSERTGPAGGDPRSAGIEGTGSAGGAVHRTDGGLDTSPTEWDAVDVSQRDLNPMPEGSENLTGAVEKEDDRKGIAGGPVEATGIDRTVGEPMPNPIPDEKSRRDRIGDGPSRAQ